MKSIAKKFYNVKNLYSYNEYKNLVQKLLSEGKVTGIIQSDSLLNNTNMNLHRMRRLDKHVSLNEELVEMLHNVDSKYIWYVILEGWCGDGSQIIPYIAKMAHASDNIQLKILLRDENPEIMDQYLSNGARSIPKLICIEENTGREIFNWGARPEHIQNKVLEFKRDNPDASKDDFAKNLHLLYSRDKGTAIQFELKNEIEKMAIPAIAHF